MENFGSRAPRARKRCRVPRQSATGRAGLSKIRDDLRGRTAEQCLLDFSNCPANLLDGTVDARLTEGGAVRHVRDVRCYAGSRDIRAIAASTTLTGASRMSGEAAKADIRQQPSMSARASVGVDPAAIVVAQHHPAVGFDNRSNHAMGETER